MIPLAVPVLLAGGGLAGWKLGRKTNKVQKYVTYGTLGAVAVYLVYRKFK